MFQSYYVPPYVKFIPRFMICGAVSYSPIIMQKKICFYRVTVLLPRSSYIATPTNRVTTEYHRCYFKGTASQLLLLNSGISYYFNSYKNGCIHTYPLRGNFVGRDMEFNLMVQPYSSFTWRKYGNRFQHI